MSIQRIRMRNRAILFATAFVLFTVTVLLIEAEAGAPPRAPGHCGFWTTIEAGLSCR